MSAYKYSLFDYHAISSAEITIDGITVLAGDNGCGKSTLSRWLYYLVNASSRYESLLFNDLKEQLSSLLSQGRSIARELNRYAGDFSSSDFSAISSHIQATQYLNETSAQEILFLFEKALRLIEDGLYRYLVRSNSELRIQRMTRYLHLDLEKGGDIQSVLSHYVEERLHVANSLLNEFYSDLNKRSIGRFFDLLRSAYDVTEKTPDRIQLSEDGVKLIRKNELGNLFALERAIYVDTPMSLGFVNAFSNNVFWRDLLTMIKEQSVEVNPNSLKLLIRIRKLLGGEVKVRDSLLQGKELHFVRNADNLDIRLEDTATGMKTFAYIQKLIENGYLNDRTLLLIDEPEVHLHPKWIFEFAHLLVLLNKDLGVKVLVASHNPDMVAAIQRVSQVEKTIEHTHFYQAYPQEDSLQFYYKDLGQSINEIFRSFNIATSRIQDYGE